MATYNFYSKVVFITGASSGLGLATSKLFLSSGAKVFCVDLEERDILSALNTENAVFKHCDVSDPTACSKAIQACIDRFGRLDVLLSCAGILPPLTTVVDMPVAEFQKAINTNLCAAFYLCKAAIPQMTRQGGGAIVTVASVAGLFGEFGLCSYNASKAGLINLTRSIALDHAKDGIRANIVCPGGMNTPMAGSMGSFPELMAECMDRIPAGRVCEPIEVARAVLFPASDDSSYTTGTSRYIWHGIAPFADEDSSCDRWRLDKFGGKSKLSQTDATG